MQQLDYNALLQLHIDAPNKKLDKSYGVTIAKALQSNVLSARDSFFQKRFDLWRICRQFAKGEQNMQEYKDYLRIQGNQAYVNLDWKAPKIAPKFIEVMLGGFMSLRERPTVTAIDDISLDRKEIEKLDAKYRMENRETIAQMEQMAGVQLEDKSAFTPEDEDELTLYFDLEYRLPEEILFETCLTKILDDNQYTVLKRKLLRDLIEVNFAVTKIYRDANDNIRIKRCEPEYIVHNMFTTDNGMDEMAFIGEYYGMKIIDIRRKYPKLTEQELFVLAQKATEDPQRVKGTAFRAEYEWMNNRPYDDYSVPVFEFEVRNTDISYHVIKEDNFGNPNVKSKKAKPENLGEKSKLAVQNKQNIYKGIWVIDTDIMLEWGITKNMIRPYQSVNEAMFSYSVIVPNNDGSLVPSMVDRMRTSITQMTLIRLKIQQLIAKMRPAGLLIDVSGLEDIDMGNGNTVSPIELQKIYDQTGNVYYRSTGADPDEKRIPPFQELRNDGNVTQLQALIGQYNFELENLRAETGLNEFRDGTNTRPRMGVQVMNTQVEASNNATDFIYSGHTQLWKDTLNKVCMMKWDDVVLKAKEYKEYAGYQMSVLDMTFQASVEMLPTDEEKRKLEELITTATSAGMLDFEQAFRVRNISQRNYKLAELYLAKMAKKNRKEAQEDAQKNSEYNAQVQVQSQQAKTEGDVMLKQTEGQMTASLEQMKGDQTKQLELVKFVTQLQLKSFETGTPIPPNLQPIVDYVTECILKDKARDQMAKQMQDEATAQEMEAAAMQEQAA